MVGIEEIHFSVSGHTFEVTKFKYEIACYFSTLVFLCVHALSSLEKNHYIRAHAGKS